MDDVRIRVWPIEKALLARLDCCAHPPSETATTTQGIEGTWPSRRMYYAGTKRDRETAASPPCENGQTGFETGGLGVPLAPPSRRVPQEI